MHALHIQSDKQVAALSKKLRRLERCGKYEKALAELDDLWGNFDSRPAIEGFSESDSVEILLRCGSLIGFHGHNNQIENAQNISRDLLTEAREKFSTLCNAEKIAECENYLALSYWRTGEFREGNAWLAESLSHDLPNSSDARLYTYVARTMINVSSKCYQENIDLLSGLEQDFLRFGDALLQGTFFSNVGLSYKNLGKMREARNYLELAKNCYERARHIIYVGTAENNLAQFYRATGKFELAHAAIDRAAAFFRKVKDKTRAGFSLDTKAQIYFDEGKYQAALATVQKAISVLTKSENSGYLVETCLTKSKTLLYLDDFTGAVLTLIEAVDIARVQTGEDAAKRLIVEFEKTLNEKKTLRPVEPKVEASKLELILPTSLANYTDYRGLRINNSHLEKIGIKKGSLAVLAEDKINRGDLVAIAEIATGEISCGFYDADFGIVCLERMGSEPLLFNEKDIEILGKIIGVCNSRKDVEGKMIVEALNLKSRT